MWTQLSHSEVYGVTIIIFVELQRYRLRGLSQIMEFNICRLLHDRRKNNH